MLIDVAVADHEINGLFGVGRDPDRPSDIFGGRDIVTVGSQRGLRDLTRVVVGIDNKYRWCQLR